MEERIGTDSLRIIKKPEQATQRLLRQWCGHGDSNPNAKAREPKSRMSTNSIMPAETSRRNKVSIAHSPPLNN